VLLLNAKADRGAARSDMRERIRIQAFDLWTSTPEEFSKVVAADRAKWGKIVSAAGARSRLMARCAVAARRAGFARPESLRADPSYRGLLDLHLGSTSAHLHAALHAIGAMAGADLDELALVADKESACSCRNRAFKSEPYKKLEEVAFGKYGLAAMSHRGGVLGWPEPLPPAAKYALTYLYVQAEFGVCCPLSMTDALTRTIRKFADPGLVARYLPALTSQDMDTLTQGAMFMTEQQAGSDVGRDSDKSRTRRNCMAAAWRQSGFAPMPTRVWRWSSPGPKARQAELPDCPSFSCRAPCPTARPTATASCG
jgi:hypothetical protein